MSSEIVNEPVPLTRKLNAVDNHDSYMRDRVYIRSRYRHWADMDETKSMTASVFDDAISALNRSHPNTSAIAMFMASARHLYKTLGEEDAEQWSRAMLDGFKKTPSSGAA